MDTKILIIDDDDTILESLKLILDGEGYSIKILTNGAEMEHIANEWKPDLVILDYLMPGRNGAELTESLKKDKKTKSMPVLMIAASQQYEEPARRAGVDNFLLKPFDMYELINEVQLLITDHK